MVDALLAGHALALQQALEAHTLAMQKASPEQVDASLQAAYLREVFLGPFANPQPDNLLVVTTCWLVRLD
jgi:hypothetical protein